MFLLNYVLHFLHLGFSKLSSLIFVESLHKPRLSSISIVSAYTFLELLNCIRLSRVISRNLKFGGGGLDKCLGGATMRKAQIYIKKN